MALFASRGTGRSEDSSGGGSHASNLPAAAPASVGHLTPQATGIKDLVSGVNTLEAVQM